MTPREQQLIGAAVNYCDGKLTLDEFKANVLALKVEREHEAEIELLGYISQLGSSFHVDSTSQQLHLIKQAIRRHDEYWRVELGKVAG